MIKNSCILSQQQCCLSAGNFVLHQTVSEEVHDGEQQSAISDMNYAPQKSVGKFVQDDSWAICCFSCKSTNRLTLSLYGQNLSRAETSNKCCLLTCCSSELVITSLNNILIGKVKRECSGCVGSSMLTISNREQKQIMKVRLKCCQCANIFPRWMRCGNIIEYGVYDMEEKLVATVRNLYRSCSTSLFTLQDDYNVVFHNIKKDNQKILILNAIVFLDSLKHQLL